MIFQWKNATGTKFQGRKLTKLKPESDLAYIIIKNHPEIILVDEAQGGNK